MVGRATAPGLFAAAMTVVLSSVFVLLAFGAGASSAATTTYTITDLGTLGGNSSFASDLNGSGAVVGASYTSAGSQRAFVHKNGQMTNLGALAGRTYGSEASGINDAGQVVGSSSYGDMPEEDPNTSHAFIHQNGQMTDLNALIPSSSEWTLQYANAINKDGQVVGEAFADDPDFGWITHGFLYENGQVTDLGSLGGGFSRAQDINDSGQVVGSSATGQGEHNAFLWDNGQMTNLDTLGSASEGSQALAINASGQAAGTYTEASRFESRAVVWQNGQMTDIGFLPGHAGGTAWDINDAGQVVGASEVVAYGDTRAFLYEQGQMSNLNDLIPADSGWTLESATGINNLGQVAGFGTKGGRRHAFLLTPTAPSVALTAPAPGATVRGTSVALSASAVDSAGVARVDFYVGDQMVGSDPSAPYGISWNSTTGTDGQKTITARSYSASGNELISAPRTVTVDNTAPTVTLTTPKADGAYYLDQKVVASYSCADATGGSGVKSCVGTVDSGSRINTSTPGVKNLSVTATDKAGNTRTVTHSYTVVAPQTFEELERDGTQYADWILQYGARYSANHSMIADEQGESAVLRFSGTGVSWKTYRGSDQGITKVVLDEGKRSEITKTFDGYSRTGEWGATGFSASGLQNTNHTLKLTVTGRKNASSTNTWTEIDRFLVDGNSVQESSNAITYGPWRGVADASASGGTYRVGDDTVRSVAFSPILTGTYVELLTAKGPTRGVARVRVLDAANDNRVVKTVETDLYATTVRWRTPVRITLPDPNKRYSIEVAAADGKPVVVDGFTGFLTS